MLLYKQIAQKTFVKYVTVWIVRIYKKRKKKHILLHEQKKNKNGQKQTKNGYCVSALTTSFQKSIFLTHSDWKFKAIKISAAMLLQKCMQLSSRFNIEEYV